MTDSFYHFISTARSGLAAAIDKDVANGKKRAQINVAIDVERHSVITGEWENDPFPIEQPIQLYGPGDIVGFDDRVIVRTDPKPDTGNFEPNYFPAIEFADVDFVWRFSPKAAMERGLAPWIALIVLIGEDRGDSTRREYEDTVRGKRQLPVIKVFDQSNLPDLDHAWKWAHVQATSGTKDLKKNDLKDLLITNPECVVSRLVCPRRLQPTTLYTAFVVPVYKLGWAAGIDTDKARNAVKDCGAGDFSWETGSVSPIGLPYYHRWDFRTSERGDFEHLVRMLEPRKLEGLGLREMDCRHPGFGLTVEHQQGEDRKIGHCLDMEGALQSLDTKYTRWGKDKNESLEVRIPQKAPEPEMFQKRLAEEVLNRGLADQLFLSLPKDFDSEKLLLNLSFDALKDGKTVRVTWDTDYKTTAIIEYGCVKASRFFSATYTEVSDTPSIHHSVNLTMVPETEYQFRIILTIDSTEATSRTEVGNIRILLPAVVPPVYGRWHAACPEVVPDGDCYKWLEVMNLDPRHRAAAGLGAEVVRKQQEALMSSAWDQIGEIEAVNDILRHSQAGRECSSFLYSRLNCMAIEDVLLTTAPAQKRVVRKGNAKKTTVSTQMGHETRVPASALDPAFRKMTRTRGSIRKRQESSGAKTISGDLLRRLANGEIRPAGVHPKPEGTVTPCDVTREMVKNHSPLPSVSLSVAKKTVNLTDGEGSEAELEVVLKWESTNTTKKLLASGGWSGWSGQKEASGTQTLTIRWTTVSGSPSGSMGAIPASPPTPGDYSTGLSGNGSSTGFVDPVPVPLKWTFQLSARIVAYKAMATVIIRISDPTIPTEPEVSLTSSQLIPLPIPAAATRFCDATITSNQVRNALDAGVSGVEDDKNLRTAVCDTFDDFLRYTNTPYEKPVRDSGYFEDLRDDILDAIDPGTTIAERVRWRLRLSGDLNLRFEDDASGDPLDEVMAYPEFAQPMYEPLCELSQGNVLPGVEKVPRNTIGLLETNRRFLESYMVGLNHEFSAELLWRGYPTDQRGSFFRQFWDVSEYVGKENKASGKSDLTKEGELTEAVKESLKDIDPIHEWKDRPLGLNDNRRIDGKDNSLVLVVRGDLLKRYPNAVIYAVNARREYADGKPTFIPNLSEYEDLTMPTNRNQATVVSLGTKIKTTESEPIYPTFRGSLGSDLVFLGFPFSREEARSSSTTTGKFIVFEERITEARFGLDLSMSPQADNGDSSQKKGNAKIVLLGDSKKGERQTVNVKTWDNLSWEHFGLNGPQQFGEYLDSSTISVNAEKEDETWNDDTSSALRARITLQKPVRLAVHADQMIPDK